jgi:hypothetical protein
MFYYKGVASTPFVTTGRINRPGVLFPVVTIYYIKPALTFPGEVPGIYAVVIREIIVILACVLLNMFMNPKNH